MPKLRVHIGHHFFGAGNVGDDLMLAGFLETARPEWLRGVELTCCSAHDLTSQRRRFPEVSWLPYDPPTRAACVARADAWLGLGDTPFQATGGQTWFLDHLMEEAAWCAQHGTPMFYLGVGVNERTVVEFPQVRALVAQAEHIWTRDEQSAEALAPLASPGNVTAHADLAHLALAGASFLAPEPGVLGMVLHFDDPSQYRLERLAALVSRASESGSVRWLAQEVRPLPGSESFLHARLPAEAREQAPLRLPLYNRAASALELLAGWHGAGSLLVSRYHAALIGGWMGIPVAVFARNDKVTGAVRQLQLPTVASLEDPTAVLRAVDDARPVARGLLLDLAERAREACTSFFSMVTPSPRPATFPSPASDRAAAPVHPPGPPRRVLFVRPDTYGDLFLFEPVPRMIRHLWPQTEVGVLIQENYADIVPLVGTPGVRWLTTACNPYQNPSVDDPAALDALRDTVLAFDPDCVVAARAEQGWLEAAVAAFLPGARQIAVAPGPDTAATRAALASLPVEWSAIYPEKILVDPGMPEWQKNLEVASALLDDEAPRWWPVASPTPEARDRARQIVAEAKLPDGGFVACAAAGTANVPIKTWPAASYGETLAWLEKQHGVRALLIGHVSERDRLEAVRTAARAHGAEPALWTGEDGEMPVVAGLLERARFYFGNDTGAMHLAAALGRPVVTVFGGGTWPRFRPVAARELSVVQPLPCFGCGWECDFADAPCVRTISTASVRRALTTFLAADTPGQTVFEAEGLAPGARELIEAATPRLRFLREDGRARLRQVEEFAALLTASEADRAARLTQTEELTSLLTASEADRADRLAQTEELTSLLATSEADRAARLENVRNLTGLLTVSEADRAVRLRHVEELTALLQVSEADRAARLENIHRLTALLTAREADPPPPGPGREEMHVEMQPGPESTDTFKERV